MIFAGIVLSAAGAIVLSEVLGRGQVVYTRMLALCGAYALCSVIAGLLVARQGGGLAGFAAIGLSGVPMMAAWLGFRIHLSNSITLEMAGLLADGRARTLQELEADYDIDGHTARRMEILRESGYLATDAAAGLIDSAKGRAVLLLIRLVCGPNGPRLVAARLRPRH